MKSASIYFSSFQQPAVLFSQGTVWLHPPRLAQGWYGDGRGNAVVMNPKGVVKKVLVFACGAAAGFLLQPSPHWRMELPQTIGNVLGRRTGWRWPSRVCGPAWESYVAHHWRLGFATTNGFLVLGEDVLATRGKFHSAKVENLPFPPYFGCFVL